MNTAKVIKIIASVVVIVAAIWFIWYTIGNRASTGPATIEAPSERDLLTEKMKTFPTTVDSDSRAELEAKMKGVPSKDLKGAIRQ